MLGITLLSSCTARADWTSLGSGLNGLALALAPYNGKLVAASWFSAAGDNPTSNIAQWDRAGWSALGSGLGTGQYAWAPELLQRCASHR